MNVHLMYGRNGMTLNVPENVHIFRSKFLPGLPDEKSIIREAIRNPMGAQPLSHQVNSSSKIVIAHSDITRATPNHIILPVLLNELRIYGAKKENITLINALGTHRPQTALEMHGLLGDWVFDQYRCIQHDAFNNQNLLEVGVTKYGHLARLNRLLVEADVRILTGFIEPHFFAGFSGGPKAVLPALAGAESVFTNHGKDFIAHPSATWGITYGNPIWEEMLDTAKKISPVFLLNVTLNSSKQITGVFAGDLEIAHQSGCDVVRVHNMVPVDQVFDVVITTNSGYPLDQNLYQCVKGMSSASRIIRDGGAIFMVAACEDGIPSHGKYAELLKEGGSPHGVLDMINRPGFQEQDQWQVQIQAMIQQKADVYVHSSGLRKNQIREARLIPIQNVQEGLDRLIGMYGDEVCILPEGPLCVPY